MGLDAVQAHSRSRKREHSESRAESIARGLTGGPSQAAIDAETTRELNAAGVRNVRVSLTDAYSLARIFLTSMNYCSKKWRPRSPSNRLSARIT